MFHFPRNEEPQQGAPELIEEQPENGSVRAKVGAGVTGRQPQQMKQTCKASLNNDNGGVTAVSEFRTQSVGVAALAQFAAPFAHVNCL